ncbi:MAG: pyridoxamine 5'-phosphate oxidase family protein [Pseudomonadota bacterium]
MDFIETISALEEIYVDAPVRTSLDKVATQLTPCYRRWIEGSRFCVLATVGAGGTDASPRGDDGPVVRILDEKRLALPDWRGNNRLDSLRNIVTDGRVSLMFMVPGATNVVRVNGRARLSKDAALCESFTQRGKHPKTVIVTEISEIYFQCAKAILRSNIWSGKDESGRVPSAGDFIAEFKSGFDAASYDAGYVSDAKPRMW